MKSLRAKILILPIAFCLLTIAVYGWISLSQSAEDRREGKVRLLKASATSLIQKIDQELANRVSDINSFSQSEAARSMQRTTISRYLDDLVRNYSPIYPLIMILEPNGKVVSTNTVRADAQPLNFGPIADQDYSSQSWFEEVVSTKAAYTSDWYSEPEMGKTLNTPGQFIDMAAPIKDLAGATIGVLYARIDFQTVLGKLVIDESQKFGAADFGALYVSLLNRKNSILGAATEGASIRFHSLPFLPPLAEATSFGYGQFRGLGWKVRFQGADKNINPFLLRRLLIAGAVLLLLCSVLSWLVSAPVNRSLVSTVDVLSRSSIQIGSASFELSSSSQNLASSSSGAASSLVQTVSAIEDMAATLAANSREAQKTADLAFATSETAQAGRRQIQDLVQSMNEIFQESKRVGAIVNVVENVAQQINLLALNASVESARAGEQGREFAVVAAAIRNLAQRTSQAAKDISALISLSSEKVERGMQTAQQSGQVFLQILESIERLSQMTILISKKCAAQTKGIEQLNATMSFLDQGTQTNASAAERVAASSVQLRQEAEDISSHVDILRSLVFGGRDLDGMERGEKFESLA